MHVWKWTQVQTARVWGGFKWPLCIRTAHSSTRQGCWDVMHQKTHSEPLKQCTYIIYAGLRTNHTSVLKCTRFIIILPQLCSSFDKNINSCFTTTQITIKPRSITSDPNGKHDTGRMNRFTCRFVSFFCFIRCFIFDSLRFLDSKGSIVSSSSVGPRLRPLQRDVTTDWLEQREATFPIGPCDWLMARRAIRVALAALLSRKTRTARNCSVSSGMTYSVTFVRVVCLNASIKCCCAQTVLNVRSYCTHKRVVRCI